jgi:integrase
MEAYTKEHERKWSHKTKLENLGSYRLIVDILGDMELSVITKQTIIDLRDKFELLPANMYKIYPEKTVKEILKVSGIKPMSTTSVNKHMFRLSTVLKFAIKEGYMQVNFAERMKIPQRRRPDEERKAYARDDLRRIINNLPQQKNRPERYWIPLLGMYSGMRIDEICQMYVSDVQQIDDVWCFSVNDDEDKKLKTLSSKRVIPIHDTLLRCGFLKYVEDLRSDKVPRLWMNLSWREADGYSNAFGKWFQRFNREHVTTDKAKVFHSLRHTVADTLKQAGIQEVVISEIIGHANESMTMSRYGKRYQPKVLLEAMVKLDYEIDIKPIKSE